MAASQAQLTHLPPVGRFTAEDVFLGKLGPTPSIEEYLRHPVVARLPLHAVAVLREARVSPGFVEKQLLDVTALMAFITRANDPGRECLNLWRTLVREMTPEETLAEPGAEDLSDPSDPEDAIRGVGGGGEEREREEEEVQPTLVRAGRPASSLRLERRAFTNLALVQVTKAGYLQKKGGGKRRANWTTRWFVLEKDKLSYFVHSDKKALKGSLALDHQCSVCFGAAQSETSRKDSRQEVLLFSLLTPLRTLVLTAPSAEDAKDWVRAIDLVLQHHAATVAAAAAAATAGGGVGGVGCDSSDSPSIPSSSATTASSIGQSPASALAATTNSPICSSSPSFSSSLSSSTPISTSVPASAPASVDAPLQAGFLEKLGGSGRMVWQRRWFVLTEDRMLRWYGSERSKEPRNQAALAAAGLVLNESTMRLDVPLVDHRPITLRPPNEASYRSWVGQFSSLISLQDTGTIHTGEPSDGILEDEPKLREVCITGVDPSRLFTNRQPIGKGAFGEVFKCKYVENGEPMAVKLIKYSQRYAQLIAGEILALDRCDHPCIIGMLGCWLWKEYIWLSTSFCDAKTLRDASKLLPSLLSEPIIAGLCVQVLKGLAYMAMLNIVHRDIKGDNILLSLDGTAKIADLGLALDLSNEDAFRGQSGSAGFMAPEVLARRHFDTNADVYAMGALIYGLLFPTFDSDSFAILSFKNLFVGPDFARIDCSPALLSLLKALTHVDPKTRPTATDALLHPFWASAASADKLAAFCKRLSCEETLHALM